MDKADDLLKYDSLVFFGKVNASISHELKNIMAIISETYVTPMQIMMESRMIGKQITD